VNPGWNRFLLRLAIALAVALTGLGCAARSAAPYGQGTERYQFKFLLTKAPGETGTCTASASVRDRMGRRSIAIPIFTARWGAETTAAASDSAYGARLEVTVRVDAAGEGGAFSASLRRGDALLASRAATLSTAIVKTRMKGTPG
jgi:hypothetical protein